MFFDYNYNDFIFQGGRILPIEQIKREEKIGIYRIREKLLDGTPTKNFKYYFIKDNKEVDNETLQKILELNIPPNLEDVWIDVDSPFNVVKAVGIDSKKRRQPIYSQEFRIHQDEKKFKETIDFIKIHDKLLNKINSDFRNFELPDKSKVIAIILLIIDNFNLRVGKYNHMKANDSYGATTMKKKHLTFVNNNAVFNFKGKSNQMHEIIINSNDYLKLVSELKKIMKYPGEFLFMYKDKNKNVYRRITDKDLNSYIQQYGHKNAKVKTFRTYAANKIFLKSLINFRIENSKKSLKKIISESYDLSANALGHKQSISKKSYVLEYITNKFTENPDLFVDYLKTMTYDQILLKLLSEWKSKIK